MSTKTYIEQARSVLKTYGEGHVDFDKMLSILRSIPWGQTTRSTSYMEASDVPVSTGPLLTTALSMARMDGSISSEESKAIYTALIA